MELGDAANGYTRFSLDSTYYCSVVKATGRGTFLEETEYCYKFYLVMVKVASICNKTVRY